MVPSKQESPLNGSNLGTFRDVEDVLFLFFLFKQQLIQNSEHLTLLSFFSESRMSSFAERREKRGNLAQGVNVSCIEHRVYLDIFSWGITNYRYILIRSFLHSGGLENGVREFEVIQINNFSRIYENGIEKSDQKY